LTFHAWDRTSGGAGTLADLTASGTGGSTAFSDATATASLRVKPVNDAPVLNAGAISALPSGATTSAGFLVSDLLRSPLSDVDAGALQGLAVTGLGGTTGGHWQYSVNGGDWTSFGSVSSARARLLGDNDKIRFVPNADYRGPIHLTFRAWDQTR